MKTRYIIFACSFQVAICVETVILVILEAQLEAEEEDATDTYRSLDVSFGLVLSLVWLSTNLYLRWLWTSGKRQESWQSVYHKNKEPYAPTDECLACGHHRLSKQCQHSNPDKCCETCVLEHTLLS